MKKKTYHVKIKVGDKLINAQEWEGETTLSGVRDPTTALIHKIRKDIKDVIASCLENLITVSINGKEYKLPLDFEFDVQPIVNERILKHLVSGRELKIKFGSLSHSMLCRAGDGLSPSYPKSAEFRLLKALNYIASNGSLTIRGKKALEQLMECGPLLDSDSILSLGLGLLNRESWTPFWYWLRDRGFLEQVSRNRWMSKPTVKGKQWLADHFLELAKSISRMPDFISYARMEDLCEFLTSPDKGIREAAANRVKELKATKE